jgi:nicotinamide-nucleotide amidase
MSNTGLIAEIITTGTEILLGDIVDTNAAWIAQQLREAGVNLYYKTTVGDNEGRVRGVVEQSMARCDAIIVTGGLGPTVDDITRDAIAAATGRALILHEGALATLKARFERFSAQMTENNVRQAYIPDGAILIENPVGTAPGFIVETERCAVIALPGVPREMMHLMRETVLPYLRARAGDAGIIRRRILRTFGIGESTIDHRLGILMHSANPTIGLAAHTGQCDVRIAARAATAEEAEAMLDAVEAQVRAEIGPYIYSTVPGERYETVVVRRLQAAGATLAVVETNTHGALAGRLVQALEAYNPVVAKYVAGASSLPNGIEIPPADQFSDSQTREQWAIRAAGAALAASEATFALALGGTSGVEEGVFGRTSGETWVAVAGPADIRTERIPFGGQDDYTIVRIGNQALRTINDLVA